MMEVWLQKENAYKMQKREHHLFVVGVYCGRKKEFQQDSSVFEKQIGGLWQEFRDAHRVLKSPERKPLFIA